ncbi:MAG: PIN domain-containing protein [Caulobacterales bacterium]
MHSRAQPYWTAVAAALALDGAIWSNHHNHFRIGFAVWSTKTLAHAA